MKTITCSYKNLRVYQNAYKASILVIEKILPCLPEREKYDLSDQLLRSVKAVPRLIAEGYAKKHQKAGFQKYLFDAMAEANETVVGLTQSNDLYIKEETRKVLCEQLIDLYDQIGRQLFKLEKCWEKFKQADTTTKR